MAKIYYLREGSGPDRGTGGFDISMENLMAKVGTRAVKHVGQEPPTLPTDREDLTRYRDPSYVVAYISADEVNQKFQNEGFYLLETVTPKEAGSWK